MFIYSFYLQILLDGIFVINKIQIKNFALRVKKFIEKIIYQIKSKVKNNVENKHRITPVKMIV